MQLLLCQYNQHFTHIDPGVVHQNIKATELGDGFVHGAYNISYLGAVSSNG